MRIGRSDDPPGGAEERAMTLWSDFLRRLLVTASLAAPTAAAATEVSAAAEGKDQAMPVAEVGEPSRRVPGGPER